MYILYDVCTHSVILGTSLCSAIIEHTNRVVYLEDNDVAAVSSDGGTYHHYHTPPHTLSLTLSHTLSVLTIHRLKRGGPMQRKVHTLKMKLQEIMKGKHTHTHTINAI